MDNSTIHHDDEVIKEIEKAGGKVLYTLSYSPELNPIENMLV